MSVLLHTTYGVGTCLNLNVKEPSPTVFMMRRGSNPRLGHNEERYVAVGVVHILLLGRLKLEFHALYSAQRATARADGSSFVVPLHRSKG